MRPWTWNTENIPPLVYDATDARLCRRFRLWYLAAWLFILAVIVAEIALTKNI
jgi:hypothetical protein